MREFMSTIRPFVRPVLISFSIGGLLLMALNEHFHHTLGVNSLLSLALLGSVVAALIVCGLATWLTTALWIKWHGGKVAIGWPIVVMLFMLGVYLMAVGFISEWKLGFILDWGGALGVWARTWSLFSFLPEGNLVVVAGPTGQLFAAVFAFMVVTASWGKLTTGIKRVGAVWLNRPERVKRVKKIKQPKHEHTTEVPSRSFMDLGLHDLDMDDEDPDATNENLGAQLGVTR